MTGPAEKGPLCLISRLRLKAFVRRWRKATTVACNTAADLEVARRRFFSLNCFLPFCYISSRRRQSKGRGAKEGSTSNATY